jgi:hypothetical protein
VKNLAAAPGVTHEGQRDLRWKLYAGRRLEAAFFLHEAGFAGHIGLSA